MRYTAAALIAGAAVVSAGVPQYGYGYPVNSTSAAPVYTPPPVYTTEVVPTYETYCPGPTEVTYGTVTYTVTEATTLTITNCPCTITKPVYSSSPIPPAPPVYTPPPYSAPAANGTVAPAPPVYSTPVAPAPPAYTGAANKASFGVAGVLAAAGLLAAL